MISSPKTIMHLIATNFYGGPEKQIVEHLKRLDNSRYRKILASFLEDGNQNEILEWAKVLGINHYGIPMSGPVDFRALWKLGRILHREKVNLLCTHGYKSTVMGWWLGRRIGIPVVAFSRGYTAENIKVSIYEWLERQALGRLNGVVCVSEGQKRRLDSFGISCRRNWVVHNAVVVQPLLGEGMEYLRKTIFDKLDIPEIAVMVVSAGRLSPEKGHGDLLDAIHRMGERANGTYFVFCGDGVYKKKLERQAQKLRISERCRFVGFRHDLQEIFQIMDLLVLPSLTEGLPNVVLEAFACAKPVIATAVGGVPEIVEDGKNGFLVQAGHPELLAEAILKSLVSSEMRKMMGKAGYDTVRAKFTFEEQTRKLKEIYNEVLTGQSNYKIH